MAKLQFLLQSKKDNASIYAQFTFSRKVIYKRKTGFTINPKDWSETKARPKTSTDQLKSLKNKLDKLCTQIEHAYNEDVSNGIEFTGEWLQNQIDLFNNKKPKIDLDLLVNCIQKYIDDAPYKTSQNGKTGLSEGRIKNIKLFKNTIERYEKEALKGKKIIVRDIDLQFSEKFKLWLYNQDYSVNYVGKNLANLKTICIDAEKNDIEISSQIKMIRKVAQKKEVDEVIYLTNEEQEQIANTPLIREALINARKWLLFGCQIGQRGGDLLSLTENNIVVRRGVKMIELRQQKTDKDVIIPLSPNAQEIINDGLPYSISITKFNEYLKEVCKIAGLDTPIKGRKKSGKSSATVKGVYPKHELISSHICRRSFASNHYGHIPTPLLIRITAHSTEKEFLTYIGKTSDDSAFQIAEYFSKLQPKEKTPRLTVVKNGTDNQ